MKNNFRIFSVLLVITLLLTSIIIPASAAIGPQKYGDTNGDNNIDIMDATCVQRYVAKVDQRAIYHIESADVDADVKISVIDATIIQQYVANIIEEFPAGIFFDANKYFYGVTANYDNDKALVGYPVTFSADGYMNPEPATARLYINDVLVCETGQRNEKTDLYDLTYTFEKAGAYRVKITIADKWGDTNSVNQWADDGWSALYIVKDAPTDTTAPIITGITRDSIYNPRPTFTVNAKFGTQPYQYRYSLYRFGKEVFSTDYLDTNTLRTIDVLGEYEYLDYGCEYTLYVEVKDANGETTSDEYGFEIQIANV